MAVGFLKGVLYILILFATATFCGQVLLIPSIILVPLSKKYYRAYTDYVVGLWFAFLSVVITGDVTKKLNENKPLVIMLNHRTRFDWLFLSSLLLRIGSLQKEKLILKDSLKYMPFLGWGMQMSLYIFLKRKWTEDEGHLTNMLTYFGRIHYPAHLVIFPEGTDLSESNKKKDHEYSKKNGLPINKHVMHPRTTGFVHCMEVLNQTYNDGINVCDVTVGYVGTITQGEKELLQGDFPSEIHFHVKQFPPSSLHPVTKEHLTEWLKKRWREKERILESFHQMKSFPTDGSTFVDDWKLKLKMVSNIVFFAVFLGVMLFSLYQLPLLTASVLFLVCFLHYCVGKFASGWDSVILRSEMKKLEITHKE